MLDRLPADVAQRLLASGVLDVPDLVRCAGVSTIWRAHARADWVWRQLAVRWGLVERPSDPLAQAVEAWGVRFNGPLQLPLLPDSDRNQGEWYKALVFQSTLRSSRGRSLDGAPAPFGFPSLGRLIPFVFYPPPEPVRSSLTAQDGPLDFISDQDAPSWFDTTASEHMRKSSAKNSRHAKDRAFDFVIDTVDNTMIVLADNTDRGAQLTTLDLASGKELWSETVHANRGASRLDLMDDHLFIFCPESSHESAYIPYMAENNGAIVRYVRGSHAATRARQPGEWVYDGKLAAVVDEDPLDESWNFTSMRATTWGLVTTDKFDQVCLFKGTHDQPDVSLHVGVVVDGREVSIRPDPEMDYDGDRFWLAVPSPRPHGGRPVLVSIEARDAERGGEEPTWREAPLVDIPWFCARALFHQPCSTHHVPTGFPPEPRVNLVKLDPADFSDGYIKPRDVGTMPMKGRQAKLAFVKTTYPSHWGAVEKFIIDHGTETFLVLVNGGETLIIIRHYRQLADQHLGPPAFGMAITCSEPPNDSVLWNGQETGHISCDQKGQVLWIGARPLLVDYGHTMKPEDVRICDLAAPLGPAVRNTAAWLRNPPTDTWWSSEGEADTAKAEKHMEACSSDNSTGATASLARPVRTQPRQRKDVLAMITTDPIVKGALDMNRSLGATILTGAVLTQSALWVGIRSTIALTLWKQPPERQAEEILLSNDAPIRDFFAFSLDWALAAAAAIHPPAAAAANLQLALWPQQAEVRTDEDYE